MRRIETRALGALYLGMAMAAQPVFGQVASPGGSAAPDQQPQTIPSGQKPDKKEEVYVFGRATELIGTAQAASEGIVAEADFETHPLLRPGELVEVIPGMVAAQHSGGLRPRSRHQVQPKILGRLVRGDPSFLMNLSVSKEFQHFTIGVDVLNATNSEDNEIEYYYETRLRGEAAPVADRMIHPLEPRTFRLVLRA
jgi:hypothetical protein